MNFLPGFEKNLWTKDLETTGKARRSLLRPGKGDMKPPKGMNRTEFWLLQHTVRTADTVILF